MTNMWTRIIVAWITVTAALAARTSRMRSSAMARKALRMIPLAPDRQVYLARASQVYAADRFV